MKISTLAAVCDGTVIAQNMPGAGSLRSANFLYNVAPKDGTVIGHFSRGWPWSR